MVALSGRSLLSKTIDLMRVVIMHRPRNRWGQTGATRLTPGVSVAKMVLELLQDPNRVPEVLHFFFASFAFPLNLLQLRA